MRFRLGPWEIGTSHLLVGGACALLLLILLLLALISRGNDADDIEDGSPSPFPWATIEWLEVPDELQSGNEPSWVPFRTPREEWSAEEIAEYWHDSSVIGAEFLDQRVEERIRSLLEEVP
jgi:hypothetical protein